LWLFPLSSQAIRALLKIVSLLRSLYVIYLVRISKNMLFSLVETGRGGNL
jgi:hypothetical protein